MRLDFFIGQLSRVSTPDLKMRTTVSSMNGIAK